MAGHAGWFGRNFCHACSGRVISKESKLRVEQVGKTFGKKKISFLGGNIFLLAKKRDSAPFCQTFGSDKWNLREGYDGPNLGEKGFQLLQLL